VYGSRGVGPLILNLGVGWWSLVNFTPRSLFPGEGTPVPFEQKIGWAPEPVLTFGIKLYIGSVS
jgi:hypothetical protein